MKAMRTMRMLMNATRARIKLDAHNVAPKNHQFATDIDLVDIAEGIQKQID